MVFSSLSMCLHRSLSKKYDIAILQPDELDVDKLDKLTLADFGTRDCVVLIGTVTGVYTYVDALIYTLGAEEALVLRCSPLEVAEDMFLDLQQYVSIPGVSGHFRVYKNARENVLHKALAKLPNEHDRQVAAAMIQIKTSTTSPPPSSPSGESCSPAAPIVSTKLETPLSISSSDEEDGGNAQKPCVSTGGWRFSGVFATMGMGKPPVSIPPIRADSASAPAAKIRKARSLSPTKARSRKPVREPSLEPLEPLSPEFVRAPSFEFVSAPSPDTPVTQSSTSRAGRWVIGTGEHSGPSVSYDPSYRQFTLPVMVHPDWVPPTLVTPPHSALRTWRPVSATTRLVLLAAGVDANSAEWVIVCEGTQPGIYASRESALKANDDLNPARIMFDGVPVASLELAISRWFELLPKHQIRKLNARAYY
ncbi:unnamed protein product [Peniophora sp. CBMAI 1063]|nr:unnamed protein product [Peniophora sp. CBMAI 1063]